MKNNFVYLPYFVFLFCAVINDSTARTILDTLSAEDKRIYAEYDQHHRDDPVENLAITQLISDHIKSTSSTVVGNGFQLFYRLTDDHQTYFDNKIIEYLIQEIDRGVTYQQYRERKTFLVRSLYALGETRTKISIDLLFALMEPYENWPQPFNNILKNNPDQSIWIAEIRTRVVGALLQPQDKKGEELLLLIETKLNNFDETKLGYDGAKSKYEGFKKIYEKLKQEGKLE